MEIKNWKLKEVINQLEIISENSPKFIDNKLRELGISKADNLNINREETYIDWRKMTHHKFFFDYENNKNDVAKAFKNSPLFKSKNVIITYGWNEPVVKIKTDLFIKDWEDFFQSTKYQTCIFSEDYSLVMEVSRDYYLHSNFKIQ